MDSYSGLQRLAQPLVGIPYLWGGSDPAIGLDCWSYCSLVSIAHGGPELDLRCDAIQRVYDECLSYDDFPPTALKSLAESLLTPIAEPEHLAIALVATQRSTGLGTILFGPSPGLAIMTHTGSRIIGWPIASRLGIVGLFSAEPLALPNPGSRL